MVFLPCAVLLTQQLNGLGNTKIFIDHTSQNGTTHRNGKQQTTLHRLVVLAYRCGRLADLRGHVSFFDSPSGGPAQGL